MFLLTVYHMVRTCDALQRKKPFENIVEKVENAGKQHFLHFAQCFFFSSMKDKFNVLINVYLSTAKGLQFVPG